MLSFEWQTQGRPLNSFIVGFKTLHFKKYKSYSQMNEGERGDWREGLLMCPVGRHELNLSPQAAQIHSPVRWLLCPYDPALHTWHPLSSFNFQRNTATYKQLEMLFGVTMRNATIKLLPALDKLENVHFFGFSLNILPAWLISSVEPLIHVTFLCFQTPLRQKCSLSGPGVSINLVLLKWYCINKSCHLLFDASWRWRSRLWY